MTRFSCSACSLLLSAALAFPFLATATGCGSGDKGRERSGKAVSGLKATREELVNGRKQVDESLAAMTALETAGTNLPKAFDKYKNEVKETDAMGKKAASRAADMRTRSAEYQEAWHDEMSKVSNPDLRAAAQARAAKVRERYDGIQQKAQVARGAYEPFLQNLRDVQTYLSNDLTPAGVTAAKGVFEKARVSGDDLKTKIDALIAELDSVASDMSAVPTPPPSGSAPKS